MLNYVFLAMIASTLPPSAPAASPQNQTTGGGWSGAARTLLEDYRAGRYGLVQQESQRLLSGETDERVRRDLRALLAMTLLRSESREDRTSGRTMLAALEQEDASYGARPECLLAMGIGLMGVSETGGALDNIDAAVDGFLAEGDQPRAVDALAALAAAWAAHMEWELTPRRFGVTLPSTTEQAAAMRVKRIRDIRERAAGLANGDGGLRHIDLTLAVALIESAGDIAGAIEVLERLAHVETIDPPAAAALDRLGTIYAGRRRWEEAVAAYERLAAAELGDVSYRARRAAAEIIEPSVTIDAPAAVSSGESLSVEVAARNVESVSLEIRRFDLTGWLAGHQGRLVEGRLSDTGALAAPAMRLAPNVEKPHDLWQSRDAGQPLSFDVPKGGYVAIARARSRDGREHLAQKLVVVSGLRAATFIGEGQVLVWAVVGDAPVAKAEAFFWMNGGTFVAPAHEIVDGVAQFALPGEAKLARDKRWACVVKSGEDLALCRGSLAPTSIEPPSRDSVLMMMNGLSFDVGDTLKLRGMIMPAAPPAAARVGAARSERTVQVEVEDAAQERTVASFACPVSEFGTFEASLPLATDLAGRSLHIVVHEHGEVLPGVAGQSRFNVQDASDAGLRPRLVIPPTVDVETGALSGEVVAHYPGGVPAAGAGVEIGVYGLSVPAPGQPGLPAPMEAKFSYAQFDDDGRVRFSFPFETLGLEGPWGVAEVYARLSGWDDGTKLVRSVVDITPGAAARESHYENASNGAESAPDASSPSGEARSAPRLKASLIPGGVRIELLQPANAPMLVLLEDGAPLAARVCKPGDGATVVLKAEEMRAASAQVLLVEMGGDGPALVDAVDVAFASGHGLSIAAAPPSVAPLDDALPVRVATEGADDRDGFVMLRLVDFTPKGLDDIWREYGKAPAQPVTGLQMASSGGEEVGGYEPRGVGVSRRFREAALSGSSVAVDGGVLVNGAAEFRVPIPNGWGDYQLIALLRRMDGRYATARLPVDFAQVSRVGLYVPETLRLGDRAQATVTMEPGGTENAALSAEVSFDVGGGLTQTAQATESAAGEAVARYATGVEASNAGASVASAHVEADGGAAALDAPYAVYPDQGRFDGVATGRFADEATLNTPSPGWISGAPTTLVLQLSMADVVVDSAAEWLNEPIEGTAWRIARLLWAEALLSLRPEWEDRAAGDVLSALEPTPLARDRLSRHGAMTLVEFRDAALDGLLIAQERDGGWGRWRSDTPEAAATAWAVDALEAVQGRAESNGDLRAASRPRVEAALRQGRVWLKGPLSAAAGTASNPGVAVTTLFGLSRGAVADATLLSKWSALADQVRRSAGQLSVRETALLAAALRRVGRTREADALLVELVERRDEETAMEGSFDRAWTAMGRLEADDSNDAAANRLLALRSGPAWGDPLVTAWAIRVLSARAAADGDPSAAGRLLVQTGGESISEMSFGGDSGNRHTTVPAASSISLRYEGTGELAAVWSGVSANPSAPPVATVKRQLTLLHLERHDGHKAFVDMGPYAGQPLDPGQHLRVHESWQFHQSLAHADWVQSLPGGFMPWRSGSPAASIGGIERRDRHGLCWAAPSVAAAEHVRDYVVIAGSPGSFLFPPPELRVEGRRVPVEMATERLRLTVTAAR